MGVVSKDIIVAIQTVKQKTFMLDYNYKACEYGMTERIVEMAINGSGIRDTARVLKINKNTVINTLKKRKANLHR